MLGVRLVGRGRVRRIPSPTARPPAGGGAHAAHARAPPIRAAFQNRPLNLHGRVWDLSVVSDERRAQRMAPRSSRDRFSPLGAPRAVRQQRRPHHLDVGARADKEQHHGQEGLEVKERGHRALCWWCAPLASPRHYIGRGTGMLWAVLEAGRLIGSGAIVKTLVSRQSLLPVSLPRNETGVRSPFLGLDVTSQYTTTPPCPPRLPGKCTRSKWRTHPAPAQKMAPTPQTAAMQCRQSCPAAASAARVQG